LHEASTTAIKAALHRNRWKRVSMFLPLAEHFRFHIPANAMASNSMSGHSGGGPGRLKKKEQF
jgi:hypothetical protein